ncbi:hypothetical protein [Streptomyces sp. W1SF4]|uniref:hypothetical protein n=1 Tax=Streptomyces sp. W1SF4 TaxID=2305220 RepID=UPI000F6B8F8E|nr:hypothetical protein [Streptomyces sp. W1SF4]AZM91454.1 hypothetical protein D1J60_25710 [Streptomyces sp. W1SF4]
MTPAEELRAAADRLLDRTADAIHNDRLTWATGHTLGSRSPVVVDDPEQPSVLIETYAARLEAVNRYLVLLGPATGLALAHWLSETAVDVAATEGTGGALHPEGGTSKAWTAALDVARAVLGQPSGIRP